jgi:catechol-2,3-dioxygenase
MQILEISILTDSLKKTEKFYTELLGLKVVKQDRASITFQAGKSLLTFNRSYRQKPVYHFAFNIPYNKLNEAVTWASLKIPLLNIDDNNVIADFENWNAKAFYFNDNNGNVLEFIARFTLDNAGDQPFDSSGILSISEMALVADDVAALAKELTALYHVPLFSKQPIRDNFAALGDDNGLLILSLDGRHWYPTRQPAKRYFSEIKMLVDEEIATIKTDK